MRCEAGAYYARGRLVYRCPDEATHELVGPELVYLLWCDQHAEELGPTMVGPRPELFELVKIPPERIGTPPP